MLDSYEWFWIVTDNDAKGERAAAYWLSLVSDRGQRALPPGGHKDITDAWQAGVGLQEWAAAVLGSDIG